MVGTQMFGTSVEENKMSGDQNFQQRWGLRGRDDADSSSDESKSCSQNDVLKKHRLVTDFELPENDAIGNEPSKGKTSKIGKVSKKRKENPTIDKKQIKSGAQKKGNKPKNTHGKFKPAPLDGLKIFTKSIIDELKVAREEMFARMSQEMNVITPSEEINVKTPLKSASRPRKKKDSIVEIAEEEQCNNKVELGNKAWKTNGPSVKKPLISETAKDSSKSCEIIEDGVIRAKELASPSEKNKEKPSNFSQKESSYSVSDRIVSSPFMNLPTAVSEPQDKHFISPQNSMAFRNDEMPPQGYFLGTQIPEEFQNVPQNSMALGFHNISYFNQLKNRVGFSGTLQAGLRNGFSLASQTMENSSRGNDMLGGGAMKFSGGNHGFFGNYLGNNSSGKSD